MRPNRRLTAREAAGDIYYLINTFGCRIRIRVKFNQKSDEDSYIYPIDFKMSKDEITRVPGQKITFQSSKVEPWFICKGGIMVSFNSCFPYIEILDIHGKWQGNFIHITHDEKLNPVFDVAIKINEELDMIMFQKTPDQVEPGDLYIHHRGTPDQGLSIVTQIEHLSGDGNPFIIRTYGFMENKPIDHAYDNIYKTDQEDYFVSIYHHYVQL